MSVLGIHMTALRSTIGYRKRIFNVGINNGSGYSVIIADSFQTSGETFAFVPPSRHLAVAAAAWPTQGLAANLSKEPYVIQVTMVTNIRT